MKSIRNKIKDNDLFGHKIELIFNKKGSEHKTFVGGVVSLFVKLLMVGYISLLIKKLVKHEDDSNETVMSLADLNELGEVKLSETNTEMVILIIDGTTF